MRMPCSSCAAANSLWHADLGISSGGSGHQFSLTRPRSRPELVFSKWIAPTWAIDARAMLKALGPGLLQCLALAIVLVVIMQDEGVVEGRRA